MEFKGGKDKGLLAVRGVLDEYIEKVRQVAKEHNTTQGDILNQIFEVIFKREKYSKIRNRD